MSRSKRVGEAAPPAQRVALPAAACSAPPLPEGPCPVCPRLAEQFEPYRQAAYWQRMHQMAVAREAELRAENEPLRAQFRLREQQLFGTKSESHPTSSRAQPKPTTPRPPAQQPGQPGDPPHD